jgi:hypothetical protein
MEKIEDRFVVDPDVTRVVKCGLDFTEMRLFVGRPGVLLLDQYVIGRAIPAPAPVGVGPGKAERKIGLTSSQHFLERSLENAPPMAEPIVPVRKPVDTVGSRELGLVLTSLGQP